MDWRPAHEAHAIERAAISFQFADLHPMKGWQALLEQTESTARAAGFNGGMDEFQVNPIVIPSPGAGLQNAPQLRIAFGQPGQPPFTPDGGNGRILRSIEKLEVREEVSLQRNRLAYATSRYDRWNGFKERTRTLLEYPLEEILKIVNLLTIKLEYWDRFVFYGNKDEVEYKDLLQIGSSHLPSFAKNMKDLWHSHVGYFTPAGNSVRRLVNVNVDMLDLIDFPQVATDHPITRRAAGIYSMVQDTYASDKAPASFADTVPVMDDLHSTLKKVFGTIITPEMAQRIALEANEE